MKTGNFLMVIGGVLLLGALVVYAYKKSDEKTSGLDGDCGCGCGGNSEKRAIKSAINPYNPKEPKSNACGCGA